MNNKNTRTLVYASLMVALSIVFGKVIPVFNVDVLRFSLENTPIILSGIAFGPIVGGVVGVCADIIGCFLVGYTINPLVTLGALVIGVFAGLISIVLKGQRPLFRIIFSVLVPHVIGSMIIKTFGLAKFYSMPFFQLMLWRILNYSILSVLEIILIYYILKNKYIASQLNFSDNKKRSENMTYEESLEYIHSINWCFCNPGLERISALCEKIGNPQNRLKFIHVAGTNGKGSFCSMLSSVLSKEGYSVGLFTSPYVKLFNERMAIDGEYISNEELSEITSYIRPFADQMEDKPTEFELITAISFEYFARHGCDYVVLECGLGGRLDSTNVITTPVLSVIVGIALDHTAILGDTIEKIAYEKAGIIKENVPCLWCGTSSEAKAVIENRAKELNAPFFTVNHDLTKIKSISLDETVFDFGDYKDVKIRLLGTYQPFNASNVLSAIDVLKNCGVKISDSSIYSGIENALWHARFEIISKSPLVIADGGHNPEGIDSAIQSIKTYFKDEKVYIVTGVMADKDYNYMAKKISEVAKGTFCITPNNPRALSAEEYSKVFSSLGIESFHYETIKDAVFASMDKANENSVPVICLGSLYMYADITDAVSKYNEK